MRIKKVESTGTWEFKITALVLAAYFLVIFPLTRIFFRSNPWLSENADTVFFVVVIALLLAAQKANFTELGFSTIHLKQHLAVGAACCLPVLLILPVLDMGLDFFGLAKHELLSRETGNMISSCFVSVPALLSVILLVPLIEQIFFTGIVVQSLLRKYNPVIAIYGAGLIYTLVDFKLSLATFGLGLIAGGLFRLTGTLYAPLLFHVSCVLAGILLVEVYPSLITVLGFLL